MIAIVLISRDKWFNTTDNSITFKSVYLGW